MARLQDRFNTLMVCNQTPGYCFDYIWGTYGNGLTDIWGWAESKY